ncbi:MAG: radical SAM protein [Polyangiaceae bacterium]|nr:radical SAM protein [Polyangiaceae bacterium]
MGESGTGTRPRVNSVAIELTAHCNQKCDYCYNEWRDDNGASLGRGAQSPMLRRVKKLFAALELDHVTLTGGEPFSSPEVWPLLDLCAAADLGVHIISNGGLVTDALATRLAAYGQRIRYVQITLNGPDAALHGEHVGGEEHFDKTLRGVAAFRAAGVTVVGCTVVTRKNAAAVGATLELWHTLGVRHVALSRFSPAGYARSHVAALLPSRADIVEAFGQALPYARERDMRLTCTMPIPPCVLDWQEYAPIELGVCAIATPLQEFALGPEGKLKNCTLHRTAIGGARDILDEGVDVAALVTAPEVRRYHDRLPDFCQGCLHQKSCAGGCGAAAEWVLGLAGERRLPDPFLWQHVDDDFELELARAREGEGRAPGTGRRRLDVIL